MLPLVYPHNRPIKSVAIGLAFHRRGTRQADARNTRLSDATQTAGPPSLKSGFVEGLLDGCLELLGVGNLQTNCTCDALAKADAGHTPLQ